MLMMASRTHAGAPQDKYISRLIIQALVKEGKDDVDFLDFLAYLPLFLDLHTKIVNEPNPLAIGRIPSHMPDGLLTMKKRFSQQFGPATPRKPSLDFHGPDRAPVLGMSEIFSPV
jgi:hypothetical protein